MKRVVYSPKVNAYVRADTGVYDLSPYITDFRIERKVNAVSSAELTIRNPGKKWTNYQYKDPITGEEMVGPVFHPQDPITILLTRLQNRPVQVFTGYCDSTPYLQLFPGTVSLKASCTLKKLQYTYFDAGLPFMWDFLMQYGWSPSASGSIVHPEAEGVNSKGSKKEEGVRYDDSGIGELMYHVLREIGGWPDETIYIEEIPPRVIELVSNLFEVFKHDSEEAQQELTVFLHEILGTAAIGSGGGEAPGAEPAGPGGWVRVGATLDPTAGQAPTYSDHNGMSFAELLTAGANAGLKDQALYRVLGIAQDPSYPYGMPMETPLQIRNVGGKQAYTIYKNDVGSGQAGDPHYKIDLHPGIANVLNFPGKGDVEVRKLVAPQGKVHR